MKWSTDTDELTELTLARLDCLRLGTQGCGMVDWQCKRDPRQCGTLQRQGPRPPLVPSDEQIQRTYDTWALTMMAAFALGAFVLVLLWAGGA